MKTNKVLIAIICFLVIIIVGLTTIIITNTTPPNMSLLVADNPESIENSVSESSLTGYDKVAYDAIIRHILIFKNPFY